MSTITYGPTKRDSLIDRSITEIKSNVSSIRPYALSGCTALTKAEFPNVTSIGNYVFRGCKLLETLDLPIQSLTRIPTSAFSSCEKLSGPLVLSNVQTIEGNAFQNCKALTSVTFPTHAISISGEAFRGCSGIVGAIHIIGTGNLTLSAFRDVTGITTLVCRDFTLIGSYAFSGCSSLAIVDTTAPRLYQNQVFSSCPALSTLILRNSSPVTLDNIDSFNSTPFASGGTGGTIYIPKALYDHLGDGTSSDYKAASNWSTIDGYGTITWAQIEGSQYENYYADDTTIAS